MPGNREPSSGFWNQPNSPCPPSTWSCCGSRDSLKLTVHPRGLSKQHWQYWMTCQRSLGLLVGHVDASTSPRSHLLACYQLLPSLPGSVSPGWRAVALSPGQCRQREGGEQAGNEALHLEKAAPSASGWVSQVPQQYLCLKLYKHKTSPDADDTNRLICLSVWTSEAME